MLHFVQKIRKDFTIIFLFCPNESFREPKHVMDKWEKVREKDKNFFNVSGSNAGSKWTWYNVRDAVLSETSKANGVP